MMLSADAVGPLVEAAYELKLSASRCFSCLTADGTAISSSFREDFWGPALARNLSASIVSLLR